MEFLVALVFFTAWIAGIVLARGFWSTLIAFLIPLWAYIVVVYRIVKKYFPDMMPAEEKSNE